MSTEDKLIKYQNTTGNVNSGQTKLNILIERTPNFTTTDNVYSDLPLSERKK